MGVSIRSKPFKIVIICFGSIGGLILALLAIYTILYYPRNAESFEINETSPPTHILIATQGSAFKDSLISILCDSLKNRSVHIRGIDVREMKQVDEDKWDRIIIINSFIVRLNRKVDRFIKSITEPEKMLVFVTSGGNDWQPSSNIGVDAITSASRETNISDLVYLIIDWIEKDSNMIWQPDNNLLSLIYLPHAEVLRACKGIESDQERYRDLYPNLEVIVNRAGYQHMRWDNVNSALEIFRLNVALFPDSWNVYDSYGDAMLETGDRETAIKNYQKALDLNSSSEATIAKLKRLGFV